MRKGAQTRERLLDIAESAVLAKGFGSTSIDELIAAAGLTKSGFFYHFRDKNELARALLERYLEREDQIFDDIFARAAALTDDPLQSFLVALKMLAELMENLPEGHPGCIVASYCYNERLFDRDVVELNRQGVDNCRTRFRAMLADIANQYPPAQPVDLSELADMVSTVLEGGIVVSRALGEPSVLSNQILLFRTFVKILFDPTARAPHH